MTRRVSESGFTLLEILVASMLLAMLVTILTMVFNSSSVAWSTGKANVAEMDEVRQKMSAASIVADDAVPRVEVEQPNEWGYLVSPWNPEGKLRRRAIVRKRDSNLAKGIWDKIQPNLDLTRGRTGRGEWVRRTGAQLWSTLQPGSVNMSGGTKAYVVGVWSVGPDGKENTGDDISTWPDVD